PFFPVIAGLTREETEFDGMCFSRGDWVMVDLFATNHHPRYWRDPWVFDPSRFTREPEEQIVAQGAGEIATSHRCPGEPATVALLVRAVQLLAGVYWSMPEQALHTGLDRFPAAPGGRLRLSVLPGAASRGGRGCLRASLLPRFLDQRGRRPIRPVRRIDGRGLPRAAPAPGRDGRRPQRDRRNPRGRPARRTPGRAVAAPAPARGAGATRDARHDHQQRRDARTVHPGPH